MTSSVAGPRRSSTELSKTKLAPKKWSRSLFGGLLPFWSTIAFWILVKLVHLRSVLSKLRCSVNRNTSASIGQPKGPSYSPQQPRLHVTQPMFQKLNELGYKVLPHLPYSPALLPTDYHFFKHLNNFLQGKRFHNQQEAENAFQEFVKSWRMDFHAVEISKLISYWQNVLIVTVPILIKKCLSLDTMI